MKLSQDVNVGRGNRNLTVRIPVRSDSTNDVLSPAVSPHLRPKSQEFFPPYVTTSSAKSSTNYHKGFSPQDLNVEGYKRNSRQKVLVKSAPASGFSSPNVSPRKSDFGDLFPSILAFKKFQDGIVGSSSKVQPAKTMRSPDRSPLCSPTAQSPHLTPKSPKRSAHMDWPESSNHVSAYPLPLPPRATLPSQSSPQSHLSTTHHIAEQPQVSSFKGQWQKGKLVGRGTFGSVYLATNRYASIMKFASSFIDLLL